MELPVNVLSAKYQQIKRLHRPLIAFLCKTMFHHNSQPPSVNLKVSADASLYVT